MTNDVAAVAFVGDSADGAAAESRLAVDGWDGSRGEIAGRRDATIEGIKVVASSQELFFVFLQS